MTIASELIRKMSRLLSAVSGFAILSIMLLVVAEVVLRDVFMSTLGGTIELAEVLLVIAAFSGVAYAQQERAHVSTGLVTSRLAVVPARILRSASLSLVCVLLVFAASSSWQRALQSWATQEARYGIRNVPMWPARFVVPVGLAFLALEMLLTIYAIAIGHEAGGDVRKAEDQPRD